MSSSFLIITAPVALDEILPMPGFVPNWNRSVGKRLSLGSRHDLADELSQSSLPILSPDVAM